MIRRILRGLWWATVATTVLLAAGWMSPEWLPSQVRPFLIAVSGWVAWAASWVAVVLPAKFVAQAAAASSAVAGVLYQLPIISLVLVMGVYLFASARRA